MRVYQVQNHFGNDAVSEDHRALFDTIECAKDALHEVQEQCPNEEFNIVPLTITPDDSAELSEKELAEIRKELDIDDDSEWADMVPTGLTCEVDTTRRYEWECPHCHCVNVSNDEPARHIVCCNCNHIYQSC